MTQPDDCAFCNDPVTPFIGKEWVGNPVLYVSHDNNGYPRKFSFCDLECLAEWLDEQHGIRVEDE